MLFVSRQLGHAKASITLDVYGHLFDRVKHAEQTSALLEDLVWDACGNHHRRTGANDAPAAGAEEGGNVASLRRSSDCRRPAANAAP